MRKMTWIWFVGCAAWFADGVFWLRLRAMAHAELAFMLALLFLAAGMFYRRQQR
jgi:hypothetical protein